VPTAHSARATGINVVEVPTCTPTGSPGKSSGRRSRVVETTSSWPRSTSCRRGRAPTPAAARGGESSARSRSRFGGCAPTSTRCAGRAGKRTSRRPSGPDRSRPAGEGPLHRVVLLLLVPDRGGVVGVPGATLGALRHRAADVLDPRPRHRGGRPADRPAVRHGDVHLPRRHRQPSDNSYGSHQLTTGARRR
jgi:hypothetical protein